MAPRYKKFSLFKFTIIFTVVVVVQAQATLTQASNNIYTQEKLLISVNELAKKLPMQIDSITILSAVVLLKNRAIQYRYTINKEKTIQLAAAQKNISVEQFNEIAISKFGSIKNLFKVLANDTLVKRIETTNCTTPDTLEWLNNGVTLVHVIYGEDGSFIHEASITEKNCK